MSGAVVRSPYAIACPTPKKDSDSIFYGASSLPGSATLKYFPQVPMSHKYGIKPGCESFFLMPIVWKSEENNSELYRDIAHKLIALPLLKGSKVVYMPNSKGFFFDLKLEGEIRMTITQYEDEAGMGAYVNVALGGDVLVQDFMSIDDIVSAMKEYYHGNES